MLRDWGVFLTGIVALLAFGLSLLVYYSSKRDHKVEQTAKERIDEFEIMEGTIKTLRDSLVDCTKETVTLKAALTDARKEARRLQQEALTALANVAILTDHVHRHVPEDVPFPMLRRMNGGG